MARMLVIGVWLVLLDGIFFVPWWWPVADPGDLLIRNTIRLSLLYYALAVLLMLRLRLDDWSATTYRGQTAQLAWALAWLAYVVHVIFAMKYAHHWSLAEAVRHTQERSGFGAGIYISLLFGIVWMLDVLWWCLWPTGYARRSPVIDLPLHAFMAFIIFCGTVVYESGPTRWAGVLMFVVLSGALIYRLWRRSMTETGLQRQENVQPQSLPSR
jgi:hypothetical protein